MASTRGLFKGRSAVMAAAKASTPKASPANTAAKAPSQPSPSKPRISSLGPRGLLKPSPVSPALRQFLGAPEAARADAVKKIWAYIKLHNLQNPTDKREIRCDNKLKTIFEGKDKVGMLEVSKLLSRHFVKTG